jgi:hypothetical protein
VTAEQYEKEYANGTLAAIAEVSGVPAEAITPSVAAPPGGSSTTGSSNSTASSNRTASSNSTGGVRKLLQEGAANSFAVSYALATADPAATNAKLAQATANDGEAFYQVRARLCGAARAASQGVVTGAACCSMAMALALTLTTLAQRLAGL